MTDGTDPDKMVPMDRLDEVGHILAAAMLRLRNKHVHASKEREFCRNSLEVPGETSPHAIRS